LLILSLTGFDVVDGARSRHRSIAAITDAGSHKMIADFRKDNGTAIRKVCVRFVALCRTMGLLSRATAASSRRFRGRSLGPCAIALRSPAISKNNL
jgi:hypothetical protein